MRVFQRLQLLGLLVRRVAEHLFCEIVGALGQRGVVALRGRQSFDALEVLVAGVLQDPELLGMLVRGVPEQPLDIIS